MSAVKGGGFKNLLKNMSDIQCTRCHDKITKIDNINEIGTFKANDSIIILPEDVNTKGAINKYVSDEQKYVEYIHWNNNNGATDDFIDHNKNMYLLNDEYDKRKCLCDKLFEMYKTDQCRKMFRLRGIYVNRNLLRRADLYLNDYVIGSRRIVA